MAPKRRPAARKQQKVEDSDKAIKSGILVCYGAQCKCAMGSAAAKLLVTSHQKYLVNDADGAEKLVATIADTQFKPPFFGNCKKKNNNPCVPAVTTWADQSMHIEAGGNEVLLNISKATCTVAGSQNSITIIEHGQEHVLTVQNLDNAANCPEMNPLLTEAAKKEIKKKLKPIGITEIIYKHPPRPLATPAPTDAANGETPATAQTVNESLPEVTVKATSLQTASSQTAAIEKVYVRPGQQATFKVSKYSKGNASPSDEEKQQVCWVIYKGKYTPGNEENGNPKADILVIYENHGETLQVSFDEEAVYTMEASGGKMGNESLMLELNVTNNKPTGIKPMLAIGANTSASLLVPTKQPISFNALFLMPPTAEEIVPLEWWVYDSAYAMAGYQLHSKEMVQAFENPGNYTVSLKYNGAAIQERQVQASFNTVKSIVLPGRAQPKMRPGTSFAAKVANMGFSVLADDWTPDQIDWYLHPPGTIIKQNIQRTLVKRNTYTETQLPYTPEQLAKMAQNFVGTTTPTGQINVPGSQLPNPGIYILEAVNRGTGGPDQQGGDTLKIEVMLNEVKGIVIDEGQPQIAVHKKVKLTATQFLFNDVTAEEKNQIAWESPGNLIHIPTADGTQATISFQLLEKQTVMAYMNNRLHAATANVEVVIPTIIDACFTDDDGWQMRKAGFGQKLWMYKVCNNIKGEDILLSVYEASTNTLVYQNDYKVNQNNGSQTLFCIDEILHKKLKNAKRNVNSYKLYFKITPKGYQLNGSENKWPKKETDYLEISGRPEIWNCKFVKGDKITSAGGYADGDIYFCCNSRNLTGKTVTVQLWETEGIDEQIQKEATVRVTDTGNIKIKLDYGQIKKVHKSKWSSGPLTIHALITEPDSKIKISTHKIEYHAQYVLAQDYDKAVPSKTPAPVHTGEKGSTNNKCPNCEKDITLQEVKDILLAQNKKPADDAWTQSSLDWLNYYRKARGINTCLRKAHFIAQVAHESGFDVNIEGFNYTKKGFTDTFRRNKQYKVDPTATSDHIDKRCRENDAPKHPGVSLENQKKLADWMYALVDENGAEATGDGWAFRGRGFIQITHRGSYRKAYDFYLNDKSIALDKKLKTNWLTDPDEVAKNAALAAYSAIWEWTVNGINNKADGGYGDRNVDNITRIINPGMKGDKERRGYFYKALDVLKVKECKNLVTAAVAFNPNVRLNIYEVRIATHQITLIQNAGDTCRQYEYRVYNAANQLVQTYQLLMNAHNMMPFPETGPNWDRFGGRDADGDNWADKDMTGKLLGLFCELPTVGYPYPIYYNDLSASDGRNIGHTGHKVGNDIDIRYPGLDNQGSSDGHLWGNAQRKLGETTFTNAMKTIFNTSLLWGINHNYCYDIHKIYKNVQNAAQSIHQNHFHLGYR